MRSDERGSLVIAMAVVLVLSGLSIAALARTVSALGSARVAQDTSAASAAADAGLADALYALDNGAVAAQGTFPQALGPASGAVGSATYRWTATATDARTVTIRSVGTANGRGHQVDATASRSSAWPWVVSTAGSFVLDGAATVSGRLASGGPMTLRNGAPGGDAQDLLRPGAACAGCAAPNVVTHPVTFPTASIPTSPPPLPCPSMTSPLAAGTYLCTGDVSFATGEIDIGGPVVIYQENEPDGAPSRFSFAGSNVNAGGTAADLIVHKIGPGRVEPGSGRFTGIIDAPAATLNSTGCAFRLTGALVLGSFSCATSGGGPQLRYAADSVPASTWVVGEYHDAPVGSA